MLGIDVVWIVLGGDLVGVNLVFVIVLDLCL